MNSLKKLAEFGQAIWLDDIHRDLMTGGKLKQLIEADGLRGMTSNWTSANREKFLGTKSDGRGT